VDFPHKHINKKIPKRGKFGNLPIKTIIPISKTNNKKAYKDAFKIK